MIKKIPLFFHINQFQNENSFLRGFTIIILVLIFFISFSGSMDEAGSYVHQTNIKLRPPKKVPTPYGGRLVYVLPGKTKLFVHLKVL